MKKMAEANNVMAPVESAFSYIPGGNYPIGRVAIGAAAGGSVAYFVRPAMSFNADGSARPFILFDPQNPQATIFPWWAYIALPAVIFGVLL